jgi:hypothetical protein
MKNRRKEIFDIKRSRHKRKMIARELSHIADNILWQKLTIDTIIQKIRFREELIAGIAVRESHRAKEFLETMRHMGDVLEPYNALWLGRYCKPVLGGMPPRLVTKLTYEGYKKIFVHYEGGAFHQVVPRSLSNRWPDKDDMIVDPKKEQ